MQRFPVYCLLILGCLSGWSGHARLTGQSNAVDSLTRLLARHPQHDSIRAEWVLALAQLHIKGGNAELLACAKELLALGKESSSPLMQFRAHNLLGIAYSRSGQDLAQGMAHYDSAIQVAAGQAGQAWRLREAKVLFNFGGLQLMSGNPDKALERIQRSSALFAQAKDSAAIADNFRALGHVYQALDKPDSAILYVRQAAAWYRALGQQQALSQSFYDLADYQRRLGKFDQALASLQASQRLLDSAAAPAFALDILHTSGLVYLDVKNWKAAGAALNNALHLAKHLNLTRVSEQVHAELASLYEQTGQLDSALAHFKAYQILKEEHLNSERTNQLQELEARFSLKDKERENALLRSETRLLQREKQLSLLVYLGVLALLAFFGHWLWRYFKRRMREKTEELREFNYSVGHDLRAPLQNARQWLGHLRVDIQQNRKSEWDTDLAQLDQSLNRLHEMLDGMVRWFSLEDSQVMFTEVQLRALIEDCWRHQSPGSRGALPQLQVDELPPLRADKLMLRQVFDNLLSNAIKFSKETPEPRVYIRATETAAAWQIEVQDNGIGFPPDEQKKLFQLFKTVHPRERFPGTGIGLALVKRLIEKQGGTVGAASAGAGMGSTFYFSLPKRGG